MKRPPLQMMPSMRAKHAKNLKKKQMTGKGPPKGIIVEIALLFSKKIKEATLLIGVNRRFRDALKDPILARRFWYRMCLHDCLVPVFKFMAIKVGGGPPPF